MKQNTRKLVPAIAMLVVAAVTLTSASYAWFTMSREVTADGIQLTATAPTNLLIASGATGWSDTETAGAYNSSTTVNVQSGAADAKKAGKLNPVSSANGLNMVVVDKMTNVSGLADESAKILGQSTDSATKDKVPAVTATTDGYYLDIPLWIKSTGGVPVNVVLDSVNSSISMLKDETNKELRLAARFSILNRAEDAGGVAGASSLFTDMNDGYIYSPAAREYLKKTVDSTEVTVGPIVGNETENNVWKGSAETASHFTFGKTNDKKLFTIPATTDIADPATQLVTVRVWIEGQDAHCITNNSMQSFNVKVVFKDSALDAAPSAP